MRNIAFVIWALGWPAMLNMVCYLDFLRGLPRIEITAGLGIPLLGWYILVGVLLYEKRRKGPLEK